MAVRELEYKGHKLIAREYGNGWQVEIRPIIHGPVKQTMTFKELSDAVDEAKKIINRHSPS
jgi:hypothetical protein